jgi:hypothetical protein
MEISSIFVFCLISLDSAFVALVAVTDNDLFSHFRRIDSDAILAQTFFRVRN